MASVRIYVEGGGHSSDGKRDVRLGFLDFFREFAGRMPKVVACGSRNEAYDAFLTAIDDYPDEFLVLLVDSERAMTAAPSQQLAQSPDNWDLSSVDDEQVHVMVQAMEAWLIADLEALETYYGDAFRSDSLPGGNPERIPKDELKSALDHAARQTSKGGYDEIGHGPKILAVLDPALVRDKCSYCKRLFAVIARESG